MQIYRDQTASPVPPACQVLKCLFPLHWVWPSTSPASAALRTLRSKPRAELAQKLLYAAPPLPTVEELADASTKILFGRASTAQGSLDILPPPQLHDSSLFDGDSSPADSSGTGAGGEAPLSRPAHEKQSALCRHDHHQQSSSAAVLAASVGGAHDRPPRSFVADGLVEAGALSMLNTMQPGRLSSPDSGLSRQASRQQSTRSAGSRGLLGRRSEPSVSGPEASLLLGSKVTAALRRPGTAYQRPQQGTVAPAGTLLRPDIQRWQSPAAIIRAMHDRALAEAEAVRAGDEPPPLTDAMLRTIGASAAPKQLDGRVPRPTTVLAASMPDLLALQRLREAEAELLASGSDGSLRRRGDEDEGGPEVAMDRSQIATAIKSLTKSLTKPSPLAVSSVG